LTEKPHIEPAGRPLELPDYEEAGAKGVLIVEDDPLMRKGIVALVQMKGHVPLPAASIAEAMEALQSLPSAVVLDLNLPDGSGIDILRRIRAERLSVKVAIFSGAEDTTLFSDAIALQPDAVFRKPDDVDRLMDWLAAA